MKFSSSHNKGFTLVEMIVSIAIFAVVALVAVGALLKIIEANKKSESLETAVDNIDFALQSVSRDLQEGTTYVFTYGVGPQSFTFLPYTSTLTKSACASTCSSPSGDGWLIAFYSSQTAAIPGGGGLLCNLIHAYRYNPTTNTLEKAEQSSCSDNSVASFSPIISPDVIFSTAIMSLDAGTNIQSYAFFHFVGYSGVKEQEKTYFDIQTSVSERIPD